MRFGEADDKVLILELFGGAFLSGLVSLESFAYFVSLVSVLD